MDESPELLYGPARTSSNPYADAYRALPVKLHRAREALTACFRPTFQAHGLTDPQWRVLRILNAVEEIDVSELAKRSLLLGPSLSRILRDLQERDLIVRRACDLDGRRALHAITPAGQALIETIAPELRPIFDHLKAQISADDMRTLNRLLDAVLAAVQTNDDA